MKKQSEHKPWKKRQHEKTIRKLIRTLSHIYEKLGAEWYLDPEWIHDEGETAAAPAEIAKEEEEEEEELPADAAEIAEEEEELPADPAEIMKEELLDENPQVGT